MFHILYVYILMCIFFMCFIFFMCIFHDIKIQTKKDLHVTGLYNTLSLSLSLSLCFSLSLSVSLSLSLCFPPPVCSHKILRLLTYLRQKLTFLMLANITTCQVIFNRQTLTTNDNACNIETTDKEKLIQKTFLFKPCFLYNYLTGRQGIVH